MFFRRAPDSSTNDTIERGVCKQLQRRIHLLNFNESFHPGGDKHVEKKPSVHLFRKLSFEIRPFRVFLTSRCKLQCNSHFLISQLNLTEMRLRSNWSNSNLNNLFFLYICIHVCCFKLDINRFVFTFICLAAFTVSNFQ